jgi:hypothetical protein
MNFKVGEWPYQVSESRLLWEFDCLPVAETDVKSSGLDNVMTVQK